MINERKVHSEETQCFESFSIYQTIYANLSGGGLLVLTNHTIFRLAYKQFIEKCERSITTLLWINAIWLDVASHVTSFNQSECYIFWVIIVNTSLKFVYLWHRLLVSIVNCVTIFCNLLHLGQLFKVFGNNYFAHILRQDL